MKFQLSQPLTEAQRATLTGHLEKLTKALATAERHTKTHQNFAAKMVDLEERFKKLEAQAAGGSETASIKLHGIMDQRMRLKTSIDQAHSQAVGDVEPLRIAVNDTQQCMGSICVQDFYRQMEDALEEALAPFFEQRANARRVTRDNDLARRMGLYFHPAIGNSIPELVPLAERYIEAINRLFAGEVVYEYVPQHAAEAQTLSA